MVCLLACNSSCLKETKSGEPTDKKTKKTTVTIKEKIAWQTIDSQEALLATALMVAPAESRDSCKVIGYNKEGKLITLREGSNQFIVLADDPNKAGFSAAC